MNKNYAQEYIDQQHELKIHFRKSAFVKMLVTMMQNLLCDSNVEIKNILMNKE